MTTATAVPEVKAESATEPKARRSRLPLIIGGIALLGALGGGAYAFMAHKNGEAGAEAEKKVVAEVAPTYLALENFTVNLQPETGDQYLQVTMSLKVIDPNTVEGLKTRMPEIRNRMLLLLSGKKPSELASTAGKEHLGVEVQDAINQLFKPAIATDAAPTAETLTTETPTAAAEEAAEPATASAQAATTAEATAVVTVPGELGKPLATAATVPPKAPKTEAIKIAHLNTPVSGVLFTSFIIQ